MGQIGCLVCTSFWMFITLIDHVEGTDFDSQTWYDDMRSKDYNYSTNSEWKEFGAMDYDYSVTDDWAVGIILTIFVGLPCLGCCLLIGVLALIVYCIVKTNSQSHRGVVYQQTQAAPVIQAVPVIQPQQTYVVPPAQPQMHANQQPPSYQSHINQGFQTYPVQPMPPVFVSSPAQLLHYSLDPAKDAPNAQRSGILNGAMSGTIPGCETVPGIVASLDESYVEPANVYDEYKDTSYEDCHVTVETDEKNEAGAPK